MKKTIYISLPISNHEDTVFERNEYAKKYIKTFFPNYDYYSPIDENNITEKDLIDHTRKDKMAHYMGKDIEAVIMCDAILMCTGWENGKGCKVEKYTAEIYGKNIYYMKN